MLGTTSSATRPGRQNFSWQGLRWGTWPKGSMVRHKEPPVQGTHLVDAIVRAEAVATVSGLGHVLTGMVWVVAASAEWRRSSSRLMTVCVVDLHLLMCEWTDGLRSEEKLLCLERLTGGGMTGDAALPVATRWKAARMRVPGPATLVDILAFLHLGGIISCCQLITLDFLVTLGKEEGRERGRER